MNDTAIGITFRETMKGGLCLGESDPASGERRGREEGTLLSLHADVVISDVQRFCRDPAHAGSLTGSIDFPPFGIGIPGRQNGVFNLFSPTDTPGLKLMVYELGFEHDGRPYYLAGRKEVRNDAGLDLWTDTTTLLSRLHEGSDRRGPVVGAGILTLDAADLARLVSTMQVTHTNDVFEKTKVIREFTRFFLGELADSYLEPPVSSP